MEDIEKVNSIQLYKLWKNVTIGMVSAIVMMVCSKFLPFFLSPVVALGAAAVLYTYIYENRVRRDTSCMIVPYGLLYSFVLYSFVAILINILSVWGFISVPPEFIFFTGPFIPSLIFNPICFVTFLVMSFRHKKLMICVECKIHHGNSSERGSIGYIFNHESKFLLRNFVILFGFLSVLVWYYYIEFYVNINLNARDWYIFTWLTIICIMLDELYFSARCYNLYLDLRDNNEIITPDELQDMSAKTYLRFYVICGNSVYVDKHVIDPKVPYKEVIDTPFFTKRSVNGISVNEVKKIIRQMTGYDGELRFFYGRKFSDLANHSLLRYFYFLDGKPEDYSGMNTDGEWMDYEKIKYLYTNSPSRLAKISVADTSRLATIILTEKTFDEKGYRKSKIRMYNPSFNLYDVRNSTLDFQDDKWIKISMFNSDTPFYSLKRRWRRVLRNSKKKNSWG